MYVCYICMYIHYIYTLYIHYIYTLYVDVHLAFVFSVCFTCYERTSYRKVDHGGPWAGGPCLSSCESMQGWLGVLGFGPAVCKPMIGSQYGWMATRNTAAVTHQLIWVVYPMIYQGFYAPSKRWLLGMGFLYTINSIMANGFVHNS